MILSKPKIYNEKNKVRFEVNVDSDSGSQPLWYEVDEKYGGFISNQSDAALLALLIPAMSTGENIRVNGSLSERLYFSLNDSIQHILRLIMPELQQIGINCDEISSTNKRADGVATGFSCGVDSFSVLADFYYDNPIDGFKVTHLLFNNVGSHGKGGEELFNHRFQQIQGISKKIGLPLIKVNSNLDEFYVGKNQSFVQTHTFRNASVPHLISNEIGRFFYASAVSYKDQKIAKSSAIARSDAITLPMLSTDSVDMIAAGSKYTRVEKTIQIAGIPDTHNSLDVCTSTNETDKNCSKCDKCMRTMLTLDLAGCLSRYSNIFDIKLYQRRINSYVAHLLTKKDPLSKEIISYAKSIDHSFPVSAYLKSFLIKIAK